MFYLISQLLFFLVVAAALGFVTGYALSRWLSRRDGDELKENWRAKVLNANRKVDILRWELKTEAAKTAETERAHHTAIGELQSALAARESALAALAAQFEHQQAAALAEVTGQLDRQKAETETWRQRFAEAEQLRAMHLEDRAQREARNNQTPAELTGQLDRQKAETETWRQRFTEAEQLRAMQLEDRGQLEARNNQTLAEHAGQLDQQQAAALAELTGQLDRQKAETETWRQRFTEAEQLRAMQLEDRAQLEARNNQTPAELLTSQLDQQQAAALAELTSQLDRQKAETETWRQRFTELEGSLRAPASSPLSEPAGNGSLLDRLSGRIAELEQTLGATDALAYDAASEAQTRNLELKRQLAAKDVEIERLRNQLAFPSPNLVAKGNSAYGNAANGDRDDLKLIFGIGPALERRLNRFGVYTFRQITNWTTEDIARFEEQMPGFSTRAERDHWMAGAREQYIKKYGEQRGGASG